MGGERRAREELSPRSNLRVASEEEDDLLFGVEQKGKREFVTGDVDEGAMTVSNPVCFVRKSGARGFLPSMAALPSAALEAEVAPAPLPAPLLLQQLSHEGWAFWRLSPAELSQNHGNGEKHRCSVTAVPYRKGKVQTLGAPLHYFPLGLIVFHCLLRAPASSLPRVGKAVWHLAGWTCLGLNIFTLINLLSQLLLA